ncbi:MAG: type II toxin-antitoxin system HicB family antitoxin [Bacteroidetes bacterium]|nr:type II toxin-antitoxin system HicB family antitoxin [Bacteroidota bacterium]
MEYTFRYTKNADGWYSGQCEEVPEAISQAPTLRELKENMVDAIELVFQCRKYKCKECF